MLVAPAVLLYNYLHINVLLKYSLDALSALNRWAEMVSTRGTC